MYKSLGKVGAHLISMLYDQNKTIFTVKDVQKITGLKRNSASNLTGRLVRHSIIARIKKGTFIIIPQEINNPHYIGNWFVAAREMSKSKDYYISHYSAMDIHNMVTHPITKVLISSPVQEHKKQKIIEQVNFEFIYTNKKNIWGIENVWVTKSEEVRVSTIERTIIDCLYQPKYCGGILEISNGIWMQKEKIDFDKLFKYLNTFDKIIVCKRVGYILECLGLADTRYLNKLRTKNNNKYYVLDPLLTLHKTYKNSWKLIANIGQEEIQQAVRA